MSQRRKFCCSSFGISFLLETAPSLLPSRPFATSRASIDAPSAVNEAERSEGSAEGALETERVKANTSASRHHKNKRAPNSFEIVARGRALADHPNEFDKSLLTLLHAAGADSSRLDWVSPSSLPASLSIVMPTFFGSLALWNLVDPSAPCWIRPRCSSPSGEVWRSFPQLPQASQDI